MKFQFFSLRECADCTSVYVRQQGISKNQYQVYYGYEQFTHEGDCIGFAVDSAGGLSDSAKKFINDLYAKPKSDEQSIWTCDKDRITVKVRFIDSLSCILARMDIIRMGTKFHSKKIGHRIVQTSSESKDSTD